MRKAGATAWLVVLMLAGASAWAADVVPNGDFAADLSGWTPNIITANGSIAWDSTVYGLNPGSMRFLTNTGRNLTFEAENVTSLSSSINSSDTVTLSFYWYKTASMRAAGGSDLSIYAVLPAGGGDVLLWQDTQIPASGQVIDGVENIDVSSLFTATGDYELKIYGRIKNGNNTSATTRINLDDLVLDVLGAANNAPVVVAGATQVSVTPVNRFGSDTTVISTTFTDSDSPGVGAFNVSFRIREPNNATELILVNSQPDGGGGLTITDGGGGSYTASYSYNPGDAQTLGLYDLHFEVSDGSDNAIDDFPANPDELEINEVIPNNAPVVVAGATQVSVSPVNRYLAETTVISTTFTDSDSPGVGAFNVTFKIREPNNTTELILVNNQPNGGGGLVITDGGGGSYTASYTYNPDDAQTLGLYDLYFEVSDGTDNAVDDFPDNLDELDINEVIPNNAPVVVAGATQVSASPVNRYLAETTVISTTFTDSDSPGVGAFNVTFKIREPNNTTELILVDNQADGGGGLTISDGGGGSYTASYTYNPDDAQTLGLYDLYFEVSDGTDNAVDDFPANLDELEINEVIPNNAPAIVAGATQVSVSPVNRLGAGVTVISTTFTDADSPGVGAFNATFKIREPNNSTELTLVSNQPNGGGGLTITDGGGGSYTASYSYNPDDAQALGLYDLYFEVSDGSDSAIDDFPANLDELEVNEVVGNNPPLVTAGATQVSASPVDRLGAVTTVISTVFTDADSPGAGAFNVTFKIREPNNSTELTLVNNQPNGGGGLTITDGGGGSYTASYTYNPDDAQTIGLYDLYFEVSDGTDNVIDDFPANEDELEIQEVAPNNAPVVVAGATQVSASPVNRYLTDTTVISTVFTDADAPGIGAFNVTFKIREPNNSTELILVDNQPDGGSGLTITDGGGGSYTASYTYNPDDAQTLGLYDLYFEVSDGSDNAIDDYPGNQDELEINEVIPNVAPAVVAGATQVNTSPVNRIDAAATIISAVFSDGNAPAVGTFNVTFKIREPDNTTELILVNNLTHGSGGLTITDQGGGSYTASYSYNPDDAQTLGLYDLYFEVSDGSDSAIDDFTANLNELEINEVIANTSPVIVAGAMTAFPSSIDRFGASTTEFSVAFHDADSPGTGAFFVTIILREPFNQGQVSLADALQNGVGGMTISDDGGGDYTAKFSWDPLDDALVGYYDLSCLVSDGIGQAEDLFDDNPDEFLITNGGENSAPIVPADNTFATPAGIERVGANLTTLTATFLDADAPGTAAFSVTFKVRYPDEASELLLANDLGDGQGGVTISDDGGGVYTARLDWDPPDSQVIGSYDLYFGVFDGTDSAVDGYSANENELELFDALVNNSVTLVLGNTSAQPVSITRNGADFTMIQSVFNDADLPGPGAFLVDIRVRDSGLIEYPLVTAARDGEQGLRIRTLGGGDYEASVLWDPSVGQVAGLYDLYFSVTDAGPSTATDGYTANTDELTITADPVLGDGYLLRRSHDANSCGGPTAACHNIEDHQGQGCLVCHVPHGSTNIYLIGETIETPNSGTKNVVFKTLGVGDPYNDPDPTVGDPTSGVLADDSDGVFTGVCEVCHTSTSHHRNDASAPLPGHENAVDCTSCHGHDSGFGGGEAAGGDGCSCHSAILDGMQTVGPSYHHTIISDDGNYDPAQGTCLTCHVNHDIFRPDLNPGFGTRARNLRSSAAITPVAGDATVLSDSDYSTSGDGGICLSCHAETPPAYGRAFSSRTGFDAATATHNYEVQSIFDTDLTPYKANCVKCHNDNMTKSYQAAGNQFGTHESDFSNLLSPMGEASPVDPLEEVLCYQCHSSTANPNSGSNLDYYGVQTMSNSSMDVAATLGYTYTHPVTTYSGRHQPIEDGTDLGDGNRHAECVDCHNVHEADQGTHDGSSSLVSNALKGVWGVEPTSWPSAPTPSDNANLYATPAGYSKVEPAQHEWQICLKCHSGYTTLPAGSPDLGQEINPNYVSQHGIVTAGTNSFCNTTTMNDPWGSSKVTYCSDCHRSNTSTDPEGPHGSNMEHLLVATAVSDDTVGTPLCTVCHRYSVYWDGSASASRLPDHPATQGAHQRPEGCFACHMWEFSQTSGLGVNTVADLSVGKIHVHGMNKRFVFNEQDGSAGSGQMADAFVDGYVEDMDYTGQSCWSSTCKTHSNKAY